MRFFRRSLVALGVAAMLPTLVFAAFGVFYLLRAERERVEIATLARSRILTMLVDAHIERHLAALEALSSSAYFDNGSWPELKEMGRRLLHANPDWHTIALLDPAHDVVLFDLARRLDAPAPLELYQRRGMNEVVAAARATIGGIEPGPPPAAWVYVPVLREGTVRFVLAAALKPQAFQNLLLAFAERGSTAALVDREGRFIGRTLNFSERVARPATPYVLAAIKQGTSGFYRGTTYEGLKNYTAFHASPRSGWSAHLAVASSSIDAPTVWSLVAAALAALGGVVLGGVLVMLVLRDMAERRRAEEALGQAQKMEAIGQLTGGIAHDFNNLLTAILGNLDLIRARASGNERLQRLADNALEAARRGAKLSSQLLAFSRRQRMAVSSVDLLQLLGGMSGLLKQSVGAAIEVRVDIAPQARHAVSDGHQLELALLNLAVNARDAMPNGGVLTISARRAASERRLAQQECVRLCVTDTGCGMSEEVRRRAVEPFFTTKPVGQGTGLGLSQVYGVVRESGGALTITSEPGQGTEVCMWLPLGDARASGNERQDVPPTVPSPGAEEDVRVLIVDDDTLVRRFMRDSLQSLRYQVMDVESGAEALRILQTVHFDLLLVDFAMPGMNGAELARAVQAKWPALPILVVSGYADSAAVEAALGSAQQLRKPFNLAELGAAVSEALRSARRARGPATLPQDR